MAEIYIIRNNVTSRVYVGQTSNGRKRRWVKEHRCNLRGNRHCNRYLQAAWNKYGEDSFEYATIENNIPISQITEREQYWVNYYKETDGVYNLGDTVDCAMRGRKHTKEAKQKMSEAHIGKKNPHSKQARQNMSIARKGMKFSEEHCKNISRTKKGIASKVRKYPAFIHEITRIVIPAGTNLAKLCRIHNLSYSCMIDILSGKQKTHKGWRILC